MDNDSAHHANIALHMYLTGDYASLIDLGRPYLDKPHFLFWTAALSYHVFGVTAFAYKFPSFLFIILGIYSTYRLGWLLYNKEVGRLAALILATAFAYLLSANDVRMDAILTASAIFALWQLCAYVEKRKTVNFVLAALGLALGFATKGWVGAVVPAFGLLLYLLYGRNWAMIFHWKWLLLGLLFFVFISPVLYAYYLQYDLHPELEVRGRNGVSGVRFILWEQNFERMQGESFRTKERNFTFFFHSFLWAFMPWSLLYILAFAARARVLVQSRLRYLPGPEFMTFAAAAFFMVLFSLSKFKLPHYLNILFPFFALLLACYLYDNRENPKKLRLFWGIQIFVLLTMALVGLLLNLWLFPIHKVWIGLVATVLFLIWVVSFFREAAPLSRIVTWTVTGTVFALFLTNANFYPQLLNYQSGTTLAAVTKAQNIQQSEVFFYEADHSFSFDFNTAYLHQHIAFETIEDLKRQNRNLWLVTDADSKDQLQKSGFTIQQEHRMADFHVSKLKWKFLNPGTRQEALTTVYLIQL